MTRKIHDFIQRRALLLFSLLTSTAVLAICSKSSPLYPMNDWVDVHCFLTLGRGMLNGLVPYVDLYEQKGPVLYFVYAIVALFSQRSFLGQYLLEVICFTLFLYYSGKIAQLYLGKSWFCYPIVLGLALITTTRAFSHGGSVEQNCLFLFAYGLYSVLRAIHEDRGLTFREALVNGIFAGAAFWIKYTMAGFYIGLALAVLIVYIGWVRDWRQLLRTIGAFLLGIGLVSAVVLLYFTVNGALEELFTCYFYNNLFLYPEENAQPLLDQILSQFSSALLKNKLFAAALYVGLGYLFLEGKHMSRQLLTVTLSLAGLASTTFMGKGYVYYSLVLCGYAVFGLIGISKALKAVCKALDVQVGPDRRMLRSGLVGLLALCCLLQCHASSPNTYLMGYEKEQMPQFQFAAYMLDKKEDPTLLNFGFLDAGFYYAADSLPVCPFFCTFNVNAPGMWETQYEYIREGKVDFVITRHYPLVNYQVDSSRYQLVDTASMYFEGVDFTYYLYELVEE